MKSEDKGRKWMWWFLGSLLAAQFYFVIELLTLLALFAAGFAALAAVSAAVYAAVYGLNAGWTMAARQAAPAWAAAQRGWAFAEELGLRPFRRAGAEAAR